MAEPGALGVSPKQSKKQQRLFCFLSLGPLLGPSHLCDFVDVGAVPLLAPNQHHPRAVPGDFYASQGAADLNPGA